MTMTGGPGEDRIFAGKVLKWSEYAPNLVRFNQDYVEAAARDERPGAGVVAGTRGTPCGRKQLHAHLNGHVRVFGQGAGAPTSCNLLQSSGR